MEDRRIAALDFIRGVAVMGILAANITAFALPESAYFSPRSWGGMATADIAAWAATYILVEGKMRGLFSFLFGASLLLVAAGAERAGEDPWRTHASRMGWLFAFGLAHLYLLWWGDILAHYAIVGTAAYAFRRLETRALLLLGGALVLLQTLIGAMLWISALAAQAQATPADIAVWQGLASGFGVPPATQLAQEVAAGRSFAGALAWRWAHVGDPFSTLPFTAAETLAYMLFGMAGLKSGFLTGQWRRASYRRIAAIALALTLPVYAGLAAATALRGFAVPSVVFASLVAGVPLRPFTIAGYAALAMLAMRPGGAWTGRVVAAGRAAFTNYLGTTILCVALFQGAGLFGRIDRAALLLVVLAIWAIMLGWSRPWLARFRYGPFEWLWRSLARGGMQPFRR